MHHQDKLLIRTAKKVGYSEDTGFAKLGFVFSDLYASQMPYLCIFNSNRWLSNNLGLNISIFYEDNSPPCIKPEFARFHISSSVGFDGDLIATSFKTALSAKVSSRSRRYYYINDMEWLRGNFAHSKEEFKSIMLDDSIVKFTRCQDYLDTMTGQGINISPVVVPDFDIDRILEIVNVNKNKR